MRFRTGSRVRLAGLVALGLMVAGPASALQCVPYARAASGIELRGDAWKWWNAAAGIYDRGQAPRVGAVMVFRKYGKMRRGHVAVVARIVGPRDVLIDHANWGHGAVSMMVAVRDVSRHNDWSEVRVWSAAIQDYGTHDYPTYGFIYPRGTAPFARVAALNEASPAGEMPDFVVAMLTEQPTPARQLPSVAAVDLRAETSDVLAELSAFQPAADGPVEIDAFDEPGSASGAAPAIQSSPGAVWDGDGAAARRARSGQY